MMSSFKAVVLFVAVLVLLVSAESASSNPRVKRCGKLVRAIKKVVGMYMDISRMGRSDITRQLGYDPLSSRKLRPHACKAIGLTTIQEVADAFGLKAGMKTMLLSSYRGMRANLKKAGGVRGFKAFAKVWYAMLTFSKESGFPKFPISGVDAAKRADLIGKLDKLIRRYGATFLNAINPQIRIGTLIQIKNATKFVDSMLAASSMDDMAVRLGIPEFARATFGALKYIFGEPALTSPDMMRIWRAVAVKGVRAVKLLKEAGMLNLKMDKTN